MVDMGLACSGETSPTSGSAMLGGFNLLNDVHKCRQLIGYCPQFDALFDLLTAREHLAFYALIKGIPQARVAAVVERKLREMDLGAHAERLACECKAALWSHIQPFQ